MVEKRRRKKTRIQETSSESELSDAEDTRTSDAELSELSDVEAPAAPEISELPAEEETPRERLHKAPQNAGKDFSQVYLEMVTQQFGEDLAALRESNDFSQASIQQLVQGLKQGQDIFTPYQQRMLG